MPGADAGLVFDGFCSEEMMSRRLRKQPAVLLLGLRVGSPDPPRALCFPLNRLASLVATSPGKPVEDVPLNT